MIEETTRTTYHVCCEWPGCQALGPETMHRHLARTEAFKKGWKQVPIWGIRSVVCPVCYRKYMKEERK